MKYLILASALVLAACASTPASDIAAVEATLSAADTAALAYVKLPTCAKPPVAGQLCSKSAIIAQIGKASSSAYIAVKAAEKAQDQTSIGQAQTAVAALQAIISTVTTGN